MLENSYMANYMFMTIRDSFRSTVRAKAGKKLGCLTYTGLCVLRQRLSFPASEFGLDSLTAGKATPTTAR